MQWWFFEVEIVLTFSFAQFLCWESSIIRESWKSKRWWDNRRPLSVKWSRSRCSTSCYLCLSTVCTKPGVKKYDSAALCLGSLATPVCAEDALPFGQVGSSPRPLPSSAVMTDLRELLIHLYLWILRSLQKNCIFVVQLTPSVIDPHVFPDINFWALMVVPILMMGKWLQDLG